MTHGELWTYSESWPANEMPPRDRRRANNETIELLHSVFVRVTTDADRSPLYTTNPINKTHVRAHRLRRNRRQPDRFVALKAAVRAHAVNDIVRN